MQEIFLDFLYALPLFFFILLIVKLTERREKNPKNVWRNRKFIHLSSIPAILFYLYVFKEPYVFFSFSVLFFISLLLKHLKKNEMEWFQVRDNYGEVFYCLSFAFLSLLLWNQKALASCIMLFMAVGDSITGTVRSFFIEERKKHPSGSLAMLIICVLIGYALLGTKGIILGIIATLFEFQPWLDDNLAVPLSSALFSLLL